MFVCSHADQKMCLYFTAYFNVFCEGNCCAEFTGLPSKIGIFPIMRHLYYIVQHESSRLYRQPQGLRFMIFQIHNIFNFIFKMSRAGT